MTDEVRNPQINISKIPMGSSMGGAFAAVACIVIILVGLPELWYFLPLAVVIGAGVALVLHFIRHRNIGEPWIIPSTKK